MKELEESINTVVLSEVKKIHEVFRHQLNNDFGEVSTENF